MGNGTMHVLTDVVDERARQDAKWGQQNHDPAVWLAILTEEVGELAEAILYDHSGGDERDHTHSDSMRTEAVQIAAVAVQFVEYLDREARP
jgi:NTP pyrophosphatase (non-canonical NTP hydrolase)